MAVAAFVVAFLNDVWGEVWPELVVIFGGLIMFLFPDEWSSFDGYQSWRSNQWRFQPPSWVRFCGAMAVIICTIMVLKGK